MCIKYSIFSTYWYQIRPTNEWIERKKKRYFGISFIMRRIKKSLRESTCTLHKCVCDTQHSILLTLLHFDIATMFFSSFYFVSGSFYLLLWSTNIKSRLLNFFSSDFFFCLLLFHCQIVSPVFFTHPVVNRNNLIQLDKR